MPANQATNPTTWMALKNWKYIFWVFACLFGRQGSWFLVFGFWFWVLGSWFTPKRQPRTKNPKPRTIFTKQQISG
jgi:hypothetical protein